MVDFAKPKPEPIPTSLPSFKTASLPGERSTLSVTAYVVTLTAHQSEIAANRVIFLNCVSPPNHEGKIVTRSSRPIRLTITCPRSEEHTSELQSRVDLVCRLLL